ncbi:SAM-dependent methyltransferase [Ornithinimicrobium faecis]|uniref:SAM-dependent methyltransferase n=1 Tax=Ornithinimicrobium faecis TaxID=2934158 RepID=A0ABY4YTA2_9MICO|nr:SAM-dependent methyltransferase [Ornithinimicrobium sp. HY1793]USQ79593.1 SAM-dependent methyltransferase [Ornithinimicrobium sp. HY1793]
MGETWLVGWQRWDEAWQHALYGPAGFYRQSAPAEHFATSAQGLGATGTLLAQALLELASRHGLTRIVEIAAGRGELLTALATVQQDTELAGVDIVDRPAHLPDDIGWLRSPGGARLPDELTGLTDTLVVAHEWLDVVPCPVVTRETDGTWHHVLVDPAGAEQTGPVVTGADLAWLDHHVPVHVSRAEVGLPRDSAHADLLSRVDHGLVLVVDYGHTAATRPTDGTLTGYRDGTQVPPVPDGSCDLTAHVAIDSLGADVLRTQRETLHDLLGRPTLPPHELSGSQPTAYLEALSRANALATLTRSGGLGDFWWATTLRGGGVLG